MIAWFLLIGAVLIVMALSGRTVERLPLSPAIVYLAIGWAIGLGGTGLLRIDPLLDVKALEVLTEVGVLVALFAVGLRLQLSLRSAAWRAAVRLAGVGMVLTTGGAALVGHWTLGLNLAAAVLLAAMLAPTDPVLASDVQITAPDDRDAVRVSITAEGGINDGAAFPFVMLGLGLLGVHELGPWGGRWFALDLAWPVVAGGALGWVFGNATGRMLRRSRASGSQPESEEFLVFGLIALTYGLALSLHAYGFVAVLAAGAALAHCERTTRTAPDAGTEDATHSTRLLRFAAQCERLLEVALVLVIGALLGTVEWRWPLLLFAAALLLVVRPLAVLLVVPRTLMPPSQRRLVAWFGIRGVGSVYYLSYALGHGVPHDLGKTISDAVYATIAISILAHGVSATPLMERYRRRRKRK